MATNYLKLQGEKEKSSLLKNFKAEQANFQKNQSVAKKDRAKSQSSIKIEFALKTCMSDTSPKQKDTKPSIF